MAYVAAATHGMTEEAERLAQNLGDRVPELPDVSFLLMPPTPILKVGRWCSIVCVCVHTWPCLW